MIVATVGGGSTSRHGGPGASWAFRRQLGGCRRPGFRPFQKCACRDQRQKGLGGLGRGWVGVLDVLVKILGPAKWV